MLQLRVADSVTARAIAEVSEDEEEDGEVSSADGDDDDASTAGGDACDKLTWAVLEKLLGFQHTFEASHCARLLYSSLLDAVVAQCARSVTRTSLRPFVEKLAREALINSTNFAVEVWPLIREARGMWLGAKFVGLSTASGRPAAGRRRSCGRSCSVLAARPAYPSSCSTRRSRLFWRVRIIKPFSLRSGRAASRARPTRTASPQRRFRSRPTSRCCFTKSCPSFSKKTAWIHTTSVTLTTEGFL